MHVPKEVSLFIFNLRMKKKGLVICTNKHTFYIMRLFLHWLVTRNLYIWLRCCWHCSEWVHPFFCPEADQFRFASAMWLYDTSESFPPQSLGFSSLCLACPDLAIDPKSQTSSTYKSHWCTSQVKTTQQHSNYIQQHIFSFTPHPLGQVEEGLLDLKNYVGHTYSTV
jgi:hypothetical protein